MSSLHHHVVIFLYSNPSLIPPLLVLVFPNRKLGGTPPSLIFHQVLGCLPTKIPLLFLTLTLAPPSPVSGSLTCELRFKNYPCFPAPQTHPHSVLPAHSLFTLSQIVAFITHTPTVPGVQVPVNPLMLDSESLLMLDSRPGHPVLDTCPMTPPPKMRDDARAAASHPALESSLPTALSSHPPLRLCSCTGSLSTPANHNHN